MPERDAAPETLLALMKTNGVARTVIIQVIHYKYDNRYLASPAPSRQRVVLNADVSNFTGTGREYVDRVFVPGIPRAGGLRMARLLTENRK